MPYDFDELPRFDLGLTMAGAVSAGAYTAGVIDFLIEALDAWESAKRAGDPAAPLHAVGLKAVSGASAGSVTGAILAAALRYDFPHIRQRTQALGDKNPLYDGWVNMIDIRQLLGRRDVAEGQAPVSLLDSTRLLEIARKAIDYGEGVATIERPYLGNPTRFIFTLTNLRGVPYAYTLSAVGGAGQDMSMHGDCMRFALTGLGRVRRSPVRADEYQIAYPASGTAKWQTWGTPFATAALASSAFPVGLAPRELSRRVSDYEHVKVVVPEGGGRSAEVRTIEPAWNAVNPRPADGYRFAIVDGGTINNEPLELARIELCDGDPLARNDRDGIKATRAVVMVDPFTGPEAPGPQGLAGLTLLSAGVSMFSSLKNQARFNPEDVALAIDDTVYSRFLIAPVRSGAQQDNSAFAIACGSLGGFGGFMSQKFREHDFFLGRRNCQRFLERHLTLPEENPLFARWTVDQRNRYRQKNPRSDGSVSSELPIVPLMTPLHPQLGEAETLPAWPVGACDPASLNDFIKTRLDAIYEGYVTEWLGLLLSLGWKFYVRPKITNFALGAIDKGLRAHKLL
jgi:predicted acylesterase/phospholipase RssA